jgi:inner membrane protein
VVRELGQQPVAGIDPPQLPPIRQWTTVEFIDLRFDYSFMGAYRSKGPPPLAGWVYIVDGRENAGQALDGRAEH